MNWMLSVLVVLAFGCKGVTQSENYAEEKLTFDLDSLVQETCVGQECARLRLIWPVAKGDSNAFANRGGSGNQSRLCGQ